jgi:hypothetical protein
VLCKIQLNNSREIQALLFLNIFGAVLSMDVTWMLHGLKEGGVLLWLSFGVAAAG